MLLQREGVDIELLGAIAGGSLAPALSINSRGLVGSIAPKQSQIAVLLSVAVLDRVSQTLLTLRAAYEL
jgi:hypothetical protein